MEVAHSPQPRLYVRAILFVTLVCATMIGLDVLQVWSAHTVRLNEAKTDTENLVRSFAQHAQDILESTDTLLKGLRATIAEDGTDPVAMSRLARRMRTRVINQDIIQRLFAYDASGNWLASSLEASVFNAVHNLNYTDRDYFQYHLNHADDIPLVGPPIRTKFDGTWVITMTRRLSRPDGGFAGVVGASVTLDVFQRFFQPFEIGKRGTITLANDQGVLIVRRPFEAENVGRSIAQSEFFQAIRADADSGSFEFISYLDGIPRLGSFHRVSGFDLIMIVAYDKSEVLASWWHETEIQVAWIASLVAVVALAGYQLTLQIWHRAVAEAQLATSQQTLERRVIERTVNLQQMVSQRDLLLREVYHRVKNNMQAVDALLAMEAKHLTDPEARQVWRDMRSRVYTLSLAHQQLMTSSDLETFDLAPLLHKLVTSILANHPDNGINLTVETISLMVTLDFAVPLSLVVNELVTISLRRSFPPANGRVSLSLSCNTDGRTVLTVSDNGVPPSGPAISGAGEMVRRIRVIKGLVRQMDGALTMHDENAARWEIVFAKMGMPK